MIRGVPGGPKCSRPVARCVVTRRADVSKTACHKFHLDLEVRDVMYSLRDASHEYLLDCESRNLRPVTVQTPRPDSQRLVLQARGKPIHERGDAVIGWGRGAVLLEREGHALVPETLSGFKVAFENTAAGRGRSCAAATLTSPTGEQSVPAGTWRRSQGPTATATVTCGKHARYPSSRPEGCPAQPQTVSSI